MAAYRRTPLEVTVDRLWDLLDSRRNDLTGLDRQHIIDAIQVVNNLRNRDSVAAREKEAGR